MDRQVPSPRRVRASRLPSYPKQLLTLERQHAFEMPRLWKQVEGLGGHQAITRRQKMSEVAHLRRGITRDVNDSTRLENKQLVQKRNVTALARWIDNHGRFRGSEAGIQSGKDRGGVASGEGGV